MADLIQHKKWSDVLGSIREQGTMKEVFVWVASTRAVGEEERKELLVALLTIRFAVYRSVWRVLFDTELDFVFLLSGELAMYRATHGVHDGVEHACSTLYVEAIRFLAEKTEDYPAFVLAKVYAKAQAFVKGQYRRSCNVAAALWVLLTHMYSFDVEDLETHTPPERLAVLILDQMMAVQRRQPADNSRQIRTVYFRYMVYSEADIETMLEDVDDEIVVWKRGSRQPVFAEGAEKVSPKDSYPTALCFVYNDAMEAEQELPSNHTLDTIRLFGILGEPVTSLDTLHIPTATAAITKHTLRFPPLPNVTRIGDDFLRPVGDDAYALNTLDIINLGGLSCVEYIGDRFMEGAPYKCVGSGNLDCELRFPRLQHIGASFMANMTKLDEKFTFLSPISP